ncbi:PqiC family protein [Celeribacter sp. SCSIO 80788]|uniref:PqiC family protein n=1 Tax=Celeribacter sp. SCSIO 80788 TaxID=3117013 RepID=UPI003DA356C5
MTRLLPLLLLSLAACGDTDPRYLMASAPVTEVSRVSLRVATLEIRQVTLPAYANDDLILREGADGALTPIEGALWADTPARAMPQLLADRLSATTTAQVAAEPWPLAQPAQVEVDVRVSQMASRADGKLHLAGQFAVSSFDQVVRERIVPFAIAVPLAADTPAGIAAASGRAVDQLAGQIAASLAR